MSDPARRPDRRTGPKRRPPRPEPAEPVATAADAPARFEIFAACAPGLEPFLLEEAAEAGFAGMRAVAGGVVMLGGWPEVWRANLVLRGATRVLARLAVFRAAHLAQLDKRLRRLPWADWLPRGAAVKAGAASRRSRIYHEGAAAGRVLGAASDALGAQVDAGEDSLRLSLRIENDLCILSLDASGEPLHRRGLKQAVGKAPMRETSAALLLRACGWGGGSPVVDPMCGSGTFVLEAAERAAGLAPGRARRFAFEVLPTFDPDAWEAIRDAAARAKAAPDWFRGSDRDAGAVAAARANAERAGVADIARFAEGVVSDFAPPPSAPPGLVMVNPPYGARIGDAGALRALYAALGRVLRDRFGGWRVGLVTSAPQLARAAGLPFGPPGPSFPHGPLRVTLHLARLD